MVARYRGELDNGMRENELVYVYFGRLEGTPRPHPAEIADLALLSCAEIERRIARDGDAFTYWLKHYFRHHRAAIARLARAAAQSR